MRNNNSFSISGKGYYIALILCAVAIGISGYLYHRNTTLAEEVSVTEAAEAAVPAGTQQADDVEVLATDPNPSSAEPSASSAATTPGRTPTVPSAPGATTATEPAPGKALKTAAPVDGEQIGGYSMDCLSYNETTRDWRVHNGVDIAAPEGTQVCAAADGTVYTTYEDDALGSTVVIRHTGGYTTRYSSLSPELSVKPGDKVTLGQTIGLVGNTALLETCLGSHVHFSVSYQEAPMDPAEFLNLG